MRAPDPFVLRHRVHINIVALCLVALGGLLMFDSRYRVAGAAALFITFLAWLYLQGRIRPVVADYLAYLKIAAEKENVGGWLDEVDADFMQIWGIKDLEEMSRD